MTECYNCGVAGATYDCNGLKFCDWECFKEWDQEEQESLERFDQEYLARYPASKDEVDHALSEMGLSGKEPQQGRGGGE